MIDTIRIIPFDGVPNMDIWRKDQEREDHDLYRFGDSWRWFVSKSRRNSSLEGTGPALFGRPNWQRLSPSEITQIPDKFRFLGVGGYSVVRVDYCSDYEVDSSSYLIESMRFLRVDGQVKPTIHYDNESCYMGTDDRQVVVYRKVEACKASGLDVVRFEVRFLKQKIVPPHALSVMTAERVINSVVSEVFEKLTVERRWNDFWEFLIVNDTLIEGGLTNHYLRGLPETTRRRHRKLLTATESDMSGSPLSHHTLFDWRKYHGNSDGS